MIARHVFVLSQLCPFFDCDCLPLCSRRSRLPWIVVPSRRALIAENVFLRKQLVFYQEHQVKPRRLTDSARLALVFWSRFFNWRSALVIVQPARSSTREEETCLGAGRRGFRRRS